MAEFRKTGRGLIDRATPVAFIFDGKLYKGFKGDSLASALLANGVHLVGRSFKYHRPRGIVGAGSEEPNALVTVDKGPGRITPNMRATVAEICDGFSAQSQNRWPHLKFDLGAFNNVFSPMFPAGFYNKTFMWPKSFWDKVYEPFIRNLAGLGPAPKTPDPDRYASSYNHCDTLIIGAGPAGLAAALEAAKGEDRVILIDEQARIGGSLLSIPDTKIDNTPSHEWVIHAQKVLEAASNIKIMTRTTAIGYYHDNFVALAERLTDHQSLINPGAAREELHRVRAGRVVLAQGAIERPLVFHGNDRPGVMLASAAQTYLNVYGVAVGHNVAVFTSHDSAYEVAFDLADANIRISSIIDARQEVSSALSEEAARRGIDHIVGGVVSDTFGAHRIKSAEIYIPGRDDHLKIQCDALIMSGGWTPSLHLHSHAKGNIKWSDALGAYVPDEIKENAVCIGACNGDFGLANALMAGADVFDGKKKYKVEEISFGTGEVIQVLPTYKIRRKIKSFVDFQNDVTEKDINLAVQEGFKSIEHVKRYTTNGMATDQGKTSNINGLQIAADALGRRVQDVGLTTFRPPYTPTSFGTFVGYRCDDLFEVTRKTPIDAWAEKHGAVFEPVGLWRRAWYFPRKGEDMRAATRRECTGTRKSLGIFDASTLGKIEVVGPDAAKFMNIMYTNGWSKLGVGQCRYGIMLREDGYVYDDGVVGRMAEDRFHVTTTTGGAPSVFRHMEDYLQTEFPELDVWLTSTTEQWAVIALNGPNARKVLEPLVEGIDLSPEAFPHMSVREGKICGVPTRLFRVSFTGELGFEVNVPAHYGYAIWDAIYEAGHVYGIMPYGTETMHILRAEKGFIIVGQDTDGTVSPHDAGLGWAVSKIKKDFVGKRSLTRPDLVAKGRKELVGLLTDDPSYVLEEGAQIVDDPDQPKPVKMLGHVTSSYWSEALGKSIAMAVVENGHKRTGETLYVPMPDRNIQVTLCDPQFYDPKGERLHVV